jgi:N-acyl-D-aspartate/D-glutamate deacylase
MPAQASFDLVIRGGTVVDGTGCAPTPADVAVSDGMIVRVGKVDGHGAEEIDARGKLVTPGFVDIHTHYDGHAVWAERLNPSSFHGVTTVVMGNCGVGFAPCRPEDRDRLVKLMEGVEDIPEVVMATGLTWDWQSFPEYLDRLSERHYDMDVAAYLPHAPLRMFVMGKRASDKQPATPDDVAQMRAIATEAIRAGAMGFSTSRSLNHRARDGSLTPSYAADEEELAGIAAGLADAGAGIMQLISDFDDVEPEFAMLRRVAERSGRPVSMALLQHSFAPKRWEKLLGMIEQANDQGIRMTGQVAPRPIGVLLGLELAQNPFSDCPSFQPLQDMPLDERLAAMREPELRTRLIAEQPTSVTGQRATFFGLDNMFPMTDPPNYEPGPEDSIEARARARGISPVEHAYDITTADGGKRLIYLPAHNYVEGKIHAVREMIAHRDTLIGLSDGGAHCSTICDASFPTSMMTRWAGGSDDALPPAIVVKALTSDTAHAVGLNDRGIIKEGMRADINVIDLDRMVLKLPEMVYDLPFGRGRLGQKAQGYDATIVAGVVTYRGGKATGALPGRLVRGVQQPGVRRAPVLA